MPLINGCNSQNPVNPGLPAAPITAGAPYLAPSRGDHLFGDVIGTIETALQLIFSGGDLWKMRMRNFNPMLATLWQGLGSVDFGHGARPPGRGARPPGRGAGPLVTQRAGAEEPDEHSRMFGGYSKRLQWNLCEIVCVESGAERRRIGGATRAWKNNVLASSMILLTI